jgi:hypothetical protein
LLKIDDVVFVILKILLAKAVDNRLAVLLLLMCSLVSKATVSKNRKNRWGLCKLTARGCQTAKRLCCRAGTRKDVLECVCARVCKRRTLATNSNAQHRNFIMQVQCGIRECLSAYLLRCSNLLNSRPHVGMGQECDFCGYGPNSIIVALRARRNTPGAVRDKALCGGRVSVKSPLPNEGNSSEAMRDAACWIGLSSTVANGVPCRDKSGNASVFCGVML